MMLPNGWKKSKIGETCSLLSGQDFPPNLYGNEEKGMPYITGASNFAGNHIILNRWTEHPKNIAKKGDILLVCKGSGFGITAIADFEKAHIARQLMALQNLNGVDRDFLYQVVSMNVRNIKQKGCGLIPGIDRKTVLNIEYLLPPIEEQKKIAATLSVWDSAIEKMEKLIEAKECGHAVLMNEMLKNSKTWSCTCFSDMATIKKGKQLNAVDMISDGAYYVMNGGITPSGNTDDWNTAENTISISEGGNSCGFVAFNKEKFWAGGHCYTLIDLNENISVRFLFHYLKNMEKEIMAVRVGSGLPNIQKDSISDIKVFYPSKKGQERISGVLDDSLSEIALLKQQLENYKKQKQGLMQKLLTGQWRVK